MQKIGVELAPSSSCAARTSNYQISATVYSKDEYIRGRLMAHQLIVAFREHDATGESSLKEPHVNPPSPSPQRSLQEQRNQPQEGYRNNNVQPNPPHFHRILHHDIAQRFKDK